MSSLCKYITDRNIKKNILIIFLISINWPNSDKTT